MQNINDAVLLVDKPKGWTSFDVVAKIRGELRKATGDRKAKVGHSGTLDPMATGLLIILTGKMTKKQDDFMKQDKVYDAEITIGGSSTTDDAEGEITEYNEPIDFSEDEIKSTLLSFVGEIEQMPPNFSAIKINGQKAYDLARAGQQPDLKIRKVTIKSIENINTKDHRVIFTCHVSSGTYIRSLARDFGKKLGCGAYLSGLRRVSIGAYSLNDPEVINIDKFSKFGYSIV